MNGFEIAAMIPQRVGEMHLEHFSPHEFREWWPHMSPRLLTMLDVLRHQIRRPIVISPNPDALGRRLGDSESEHNIDRWGEVLAVDCFVIGIETRAQVGWVLTFSRAIGFTGIGVYPDWTLQGRQTIGFHFGVRPTRQMRDPATWGRLGGEYVSQSDAVGAIGVA